MGTYLNPGAFAFQTAINSEIFIDKTEMIQYVNSVVNTSQKYLCVSRPRRFGKTMAADMLCAYYGRDAGSRELFEGLLICKNFRPAQVNTWDKYLGAFDVIRLTMTQFIKRNLSMHNVLDRLQRLVTRELTKAYPEVDSQPPRNLGRKLTGIV